MNRLPPSKKLLLSSAQFGLEGGELTSKSRRLHHKEISDEEISTPTQKCRNIYEKARLARRPRPAVGAVRPLPSQDEQLRCNKELVISNRNALPLSKRRRSQLDFFNMISGMDRNSLRDVQIELIQVDDHLGEEQVSEEEDVFVG